jgi:signal transduction histidine kinase
MKWIQAAACVVGLVVGACLAAAPARAAEQEVRVLILNGVDPYLPAYLAVDAAMRARLANEPGRRIVYFSDPLDAQRFSLESLESEHLALMAKKYSGQRIDVVVAVTRPALDFFIRHGQQLWPGARLVVQSLSGRDIDRSALPPGALGVLAQVDIGGTVDIARRLQPDARRILVVAGSSALDRVLEQDARLVLSGRADVESVDFLSGWPLPDVEVRLRAVTKDTIVLYLTQFRDRDGRPYTPREFLLAISGASAAPVYALIDPMIGFGAAAGSTQSFEETGRLVAEQIIAALADVPPEPGRVLLQAPSRCVAAAPALQRWSLDEGRLPAGCEIRFADHPFWREHLSQILAGLGVIAAQTLLIAALLIQRRQRRRAETESKKRLSEVVHLNRRVALGEMSASIAHELNQPLGAIRNNVGAAEMLMKADPPRLGEVMEILGDIKRDDQRASDIIARIRKMLNRTEFELRDIDLNDAVRETANMLAHEAAAKGVALKTELDPALPKVSADRIQIQQVLMNLALNGIEAMFDRPAALRQLVIRSRCANGKEAEVSVADSGAGIPAALLPRIFDAFVTSKAAGMGLGLAISRTIVEAHGGQLRAENAPTGGAVFHFTLPLAAARQA